MDVCVFATLQPVTHPPPTCAALLQAAYSSEAGEESVVCVLSCCVPALRQLVQFLSLNGEVLAAAAGELDEEVGVLVGFLAALWALGCIWCGCSRVCSSNTVAALAGMYLQLSAPALGTAGHVLCVPLRLAGTMQACVCTYATSGAQGQTPRHSFCLSGSSHAAAASDANMPLSSAGVIQCPSMPSVLPHGQAQKFCGQPASCTLPCTSSACPALMHLLCLVMRPSPTCLDVCPALALPLKPNCWLQGSLGVDDDDDDLLSGLGGIMRQQQQRKLMHGALLACHLLLAVVASPHVDALSAWLTVADELAASVGEQLGIQQNVGTTAAQAAFPDLPRQVQQPSNRKALGGLPPAVTLGGWGTAAHQDYQLLLQMRGYAAAAQQLVQHWRFAGNGSCVGTGNVLLQLLNSCLPPFTKVEDPSKTWAGDGADAAGGGAGPGSNNPHTDALRGAALAAGVPPPWGYDVEATAAMRLMHDADSRCGTLYCLNMLTMLLQGAPHGLRSYARKLGDRPRERVQLQARPGLNNSVALNPDGSLGPWAPIPEGGSAAAPAVTQQALIEDGLEPRLLLRELLDGNVMDVLDRALRTATCALLASDVDMLKGSDGGMPEVRASWCSVCACLV